MKGACQIPTNASVEELTAACDDDHAFCVQGVCQCDDNYITTRDYTCGERLQLILTFFVKRNNESAPSKGKELDLVVDFLIASQTCFAEGEQIKRILTVFINTDELSLIETDLL